MSALQLQRSLYKPSKLNTDLNPLKWDFQYITFDSSPSKSRASRSSDSLTAPTERGFWEEGTMHTRRYYNILPPEPAACKQLITLSSSRRRYMFCTFSHLQNEECLRLLTMLGSKNFSIQGELSPLSFVSLYVLIQRG